MYTRVFVGAHHKCGTVWLDQIFKAFTDVLGYTYVHQGGENFNEYARVVFSANSHFADLLFTDFRGVHIVRDPRDVCISGVRYHVSDYARENEAWLTDKKIDGISYSDYLRNLSIEEQIVVEAREVTDSTINEIFQVTENDSFLTVKYEDLINPCTIVKTCDLISAHLDFDALERMVFFGCVLTTHRHFVDTHLPEHFTSHGFPRGWESEDTSVRNLLNDLFIKQCNILGYV